MVSCFFAWFALPGSPLCRRAGNMYLLAHVGYVRWSANERRHLYTCLWVHARFIVLSWHYFLRVFLCLVVHWKISFQRVILRHLYLHPVFLFICFVLTDVDEMELRDTDLCARIFNFTIKGCAKYLFAYGFFFMQWSTLQ